MKVVGICGSPRKGNSELLLREVLKSVKDGGADIELILLRGKHIEYCDGCTECEESGECHKTDDMQEIYKKIESADGIVLASPNYYDNVSGLMKSFIDRTLVYYNKRRAKKIKGKLGGIIAVGGGSSHEVVEKLKVFFSAYEIKLVGIVEAIAGKAGEVAKDKRALLAARGLGKEIVERLK